MYRNLGATISSFFIAWVSVCLVASGHYYSSVLVCFFIPVTFAAVNYNK